MMLPYPVANNRMYRNWHGRMVLSAEGRAYKDHVAWIAKTHKVKLIDGDVAVTMLFHPRQNKDGSASKVRQDIGEISKGIFDALNGIAYHDDKQIVAMSTVIVDPVQDGGVSILIEKYEGGVWKLATK